MRLLHDAFGEDLSVGDDVAFAGTDMYRKPTINKGEIDALDFRSQKVRVLREGRSGNSVADSEWRRVWVEVSKVARLHS